MHKNDGLENYLKKKKNFTSGRFCLTPGSVGVRLHFWEAPGWFTCMPESSNFVYTLRVAKYIWTENKTAEIYFAFFFFFSISHSSAIYIGKFVTKISQELLHIEFCNLVQVLWIICCCMWERTRLLLLILPLISSFFFPIFKCQIISSFFSQGLTGLQSWNLVHTWTVGRCIMCTWLRLLVLIYSFISSVFFQIPRH